MTTSPPRVLAFPAMLHGLTDAVLRDVETWGKKWAREYLETGTFTQPQGMLQVPPGELLIVDSGADSNLVPRPRWRVHLFSDIFMTLNAGVPKGGRLRMEESFESFCRSMPWGALFHAVFPYPSWSAERMARRFAALLRFWDVLEGPRYAFWFGREDTLGELVEELYGMMFKAWCPGDFASVREHLSLTVERMTRATREECMEVLLRAIPVLVEWDGGFKHCEVLKDPGFLRERLLTLPPAQWENLSSAYRHALTGPLCAWDRELGRH